MNEFTKRQQDCLKYRVYDEANKRYGLSAYTRRDPEDSSITLLEPPAGKIIERATGQMDTKDRLIFEGDQVRDKYGNIYNVIWNPIRCQFRATKGCSWYLTDSIEIQPGQEIIGNIHESEATK